MTDNNKIAKDKEDDVSESPETSKNKTEEEDSHSKPLPEKPEIPSDKDLNTSQSQENPKISETPKHQNDSDSNSPQISKQKERGASMEMPETAKNEKDHQIDSDPNHKNQDISDTNAPKQESEKLSESAELQDAVRELLGRDRLPGSLGNREDFATDITFNIGPELGFRGDAFLSFSLAL